MDKVGGERARRSETKHSVGSSRSHSLIHNAHSSAERRCYAFLCARKVATSRRGGDAVRGQSKGCSGENPLGAGAGAGMPITLADLTRDDEKGHI